MPWKLLSLLTIAWAPLAFPQSDGLPARETLHYNIEWRLVTAGKAKLDWVSRGSSGWQVNLNVESVGLVSKLFKVDDQYSAMLNSALCAQTAHSVTHEGNRFRETNITFNSETRKASYTERDTVKNAVVLSKETEIPPCVHDLTGGLYFLRTLNLETSQSVQVPVSDGKKSVIAKVEAQQHEDIKTPLGTFKTTRYEIYVFNNVLYRRPAHLYVWMTDDRRKLPVQIRVRMTLAIGTITLQLEKRE